MPCNICKKFFKAKPCEKDKSKITKIIKSKMKAPTHTTKILLDLYRSLVIGCPCEDCLVKMMCNVECLKYESAIRPLIIQKRKRLK